MLEFLKKHTRSPFGWVILFVLVLLLAYGVFVWVEKAEAPGERTDVIGVDGVEVVEVEQGKVLVLNENDGYELVVPENWDISSIDGTLILNGLEAEEIGSSGVTGVGCKVTIAETNITDLNNHFDLYCKSNIDCSSYIIKSYNSRIFSITVEGSFMGSGTTEYYLESAKDGGVYQRITMLCSDEEQKKNNIDNILSSLVRSLN